MRLKRICFAVGCAVRTIGSALDRGSGVQDCTLAGMNLQSCKPDPGYPGYLNLIYKRFEGGTFLP